MKRTNFEGAWGFVRARNIRDSGNRQVPAGSWAAC